MWIFTRCRDPRFLETGLLLSYVQFYVKCMYTVNERIRSRRGGGGGRQCTCSITLRRVSETIVAMARQYYIFCVCVCVILRRIQRYSVMNVRRYACKVPVILVRF